MTETYKNLHFVVDCEARGPCPSLGNLTEIGIVIVETDVEFYSDLRGEKIGPNRWDCLPVSEEIQKKECQRLVDFINDQPCYFPVFVSDNNGFDWQWINDFLWRYNGANPFSFSSRRIGDFAAGLRCKWSDQSSWKKLRVTTHDHNPVNDARGNAEALRKMLLLAK